MLGSVRCCLRRGSVGSMARDRMPRLQRYTPTSTRAPSPNSTQRKSHMASYAYIAASLNRFVDVDRHHARHAGLLHRHSRELMHRLHRRLVVRDDDELHALGHLLDDLREAPDVRVVERCVDLVEQAERRRVQLEDREHERDGRQRLLAARQQMNRADLLAGRARHDRDARGEHVLAVHLEIRLAAAEEPREQAAEAVIRLVERILETRARLRSILRIAFSSVSSASVRSVNCASRYFLRSDCSWNSSIAARLIAPSRWIRRSS